MLCGLTARQEVAVNSLLQSILVRSESEGVFLCNEGGYILSSCIARHYGYDENIAALAVGSFFATREIARLVGETEFRSVVNQGNNKGIFMQIAAMDLLLVIVFGSETNPGLVKLYAEDGSLSLAEILDNSSASIDLETSFNGLQLDLTEAPVFRSQRPKPEIATA